VWEVFGEAGGHYVEVCEADLVSIVSLDASV
jgi:hypothetical protein